MPTLEDEGLISGQSLAIIEYLEEDIPRLRSCRGGADGACAGARTRAQRRLRHPSAEQTARAADILPSPLGLDEETTQRVGPTLDRARNRGDRAEAAQQPEVSGPYCFGAAPTLADCCLIPQIFNAQRVQLSLDEFPNIRRIHDHCMQQEALVRAPPPERRAMPNRTATPVRDLALHLQEYLPYRLSVTSQCGVTVDRARLRVAICAEDSAVASDRGAVR